jgi:hypothetical protein
MAKEKKKSAKEASNTFHNIMKASVSNPKLQKMTHKRFQHNRTVDEGTDVQFNLEYDGNDISVTNIQLHSNYKSGLPHSAYLEYNKKEGKWRLCTYDHRIVNDKEEKIKEWLTSDLAQEICDMILEIKEKEKPNFTP